MSRRLSLLLFVIFPLLLSAQNVRTVKGECTYYAPGNVSVDMAKRTALERAKIQALADVFGTVIGSNTATGISEGKVNMSSLSFSEVRGEWLEDVSEPVYDIYYEQDMLVVNVKVKGRARRISGAKVGFEAAILRNGTERKYESADFRDGDDFFLYFKSPVNGYLAVYLVDDNDTAYCLLPYSGDDAGHVRVSGNKEYIFFSPEHADEGERPTVDELYMTTDSQSCINTVYVIFSPNEFVKAVDRRRDRGDRLLPRETTVREFMKWLAAARTHDPKMTVTQKDIMIVQR